MKTGDGAGKTAARGGLGSAVTGLGAKHVVTLALVHTDHLAGWLGGLGLVSHSGGPGPVNLFQIFKVFPNCIQMINHQKYKKGNSIVPKIYKLCQTVDTFIRNNFTFGKDYKFPK
jgi:hypothetical protein